MDPVPDPYLLPNGTLTNKLGETNQESLSIREAQIVAAKALQFRRKGHSGGFNRFVLRAIHWRLFGDVYEWAGQFRSTSLLKQFESGKSAFSAFTAPHLLEEQSKEIDGELAAKNFLRGTDRHAFSLEAADIFVKMNRLHPFREGNGRTHRLFLEFLARSAGHQLDFSVVTQDRMVEASIQGHQGDPAPMRRMFLEISDQERVLALRRALRALDEGEIPRNSLYIATTVEGQSYQGRLIGKAGSDFLMQSHGDQTRLLVGHVDDIGEHTDDLDDVSFTASRFGPK